MNTEESVGHRVARVRGAVAVARSIEQAGYAAFDLHLRDAAIYRPIRAPIPPYLTPTAHPGCVALTTASAVPPASTPAAAT